jgi:polyferredoxin
MFTILTIAAAFALLLAVLGRRVWLAWHTPLPTTTESIARLPSGRHRRAKGEAPSWRIQTYGRHAAA